MIFICTATKIKYVYVPFINPSGCHIKAYILKKSHFLKKNCFNKLPEAAVKLSGRYTIAIITRYTGM